MIQLSFAWARVHPWSCVLVWVIMLFLRDVGKTFNRWASRYDQAAVMTHEIGERLFERLDYLKINPRCVLDLGGGSGAFTSRLKKRYPKAHVMSVDLAEQMLQVSKKKQGYFQRYPLICADMHALPFANGAFDFIFANQTLHWASPLSLALAEVHRVLAVGGCLMFSMLGPDSFYELSKPVSAHKPVKGHDLLDMHDIGDDLLAQHFIDPVVDMEKIVGHYRDWPALLNGLRATGLRNYHSARCCGLTTKADWIEFEKYVRKYCNNAGKFPLTHEVIYGHAWRGEARQLRDGDTTFVPLSMLRRPRVNMKE